MLPRAVSREALLSEVEDLIRSAPAFDHFRDVENMDWLGRAGAVVEAWGKGLEWGLLTIRLNGAQATGGISREMLTMLHQARHDLRMRTVGSLGAAFDQGRVFDYFDEVRKAIASAQEDLLFVDPYLDAEFASRYLPHARENVCVRLLTSKHVAALASAVELVEQQHKVRVSIRTATGLHDRYLFVDRAACFHSGASFKDGAKRAPTTLQQIADVFAEVAAAYETKWTEAQPVR